MATRNPGRTHQLRLVVFPIIYRVSYISRGCLGFLPSGCHERFVGWRNRESRAKPLFATATGWWINPIYTTWWLKRKNTKQKKNLQIVGLFGGGPTSFLGWDINNQTVGFLEISAQFLRRKMMCKISRSSAQGPQNPLIYYLGVPGS